MVTWSKDEVIDKEGACETSSDWARVDQIYVQQTTDPDKVDPLYIVVRCLITHGVVKEGFTEDEYMDAIQKNTPHSTIGARILISSYALKILQRKMPGSDRALFTFSIAR